MKTRSELEIRDAVRRLVAERVDDVPPDESASLLASTSLDSFGAVALLLAVEEEFNVSIDVVTVDPVSLLSISGLAHYVSAFAEKV